MGYTLSVQSRMSTRLPREMPAALRLPLTRARLVLIALLCLTMASCDGCSTDSARQAVDGGSAAGSTSGTDAVTPPVDDERAESVPSWPTTSKALSDVLADSLAREGEQRVGLESLGGQPRKRLIYAPQVGSEATLQLVIELSVMVSFGNSDQLEVEAVPRLLLRLATKVLDPDPKDDRKSLQIRFLQVRADPKGEAEQAVARQMKGLFEQLQAVSIVFQFDERGRVVDTPRPPRETAPEVLQLYTSVAEALAEMLIVLPRQQVGVGARWKVLRRLRRAGVTMIRQSSYELKKADNAVMTIAAAIRELPVDSNKKDPALADQVILKLLAGTSGGTQTLLRAIGAVVPSQSDSKLIGRVSMKVRPPEQLGAEPVESTVRLEQHFSLGPVAAGSQGAGGGAANPAASAASSSTPQEH